ncbi:MAG: putative toxin-antitoxin system toxin component, PIN family [Thermodesulfobacteriota bacterium]|nr:putative toxin-antitoxin system toxin component, PIN family [Thermodesulfobacteriota bacterium]
MAKIVIDANVIISASFGGKPLEAVVRAMEDHEVYWSPSIERELYETISGLSKKLSGDQIDFVREKIGQLLVLAKRISISTHVVLSRDAKDDHYLSLCKETGADFLITGDKDLLSIAKESLEKEGISCSIVSPHQFLEHSV